MPSYTCGRCGQESSYQGHHFRSCKSPKWWEGRDGSPLDEANMREHHQCCPQPFGCELDAVAAKAEDPFALPERIDVFDDVSYPDEVSR